MMTATNSTFNLAIAHVNNGGKVMLRFINPNGYVFHRLASNENGIIVNIDKGYQLCDPRMWPGYGGTN